MRRPVRGSSPLARGLLEALPLLSDPYRIIPARAGFTSDRHAQRSGTTDHPRSRGVYAWAAITAEFKKGSSPLARGLRAWLSPFKAGPRIIPARAGFTRHACPPGRRPRDHPRSRGVYVAHMAAPEISLGSSPLARGLRLDLGLTSHRVGIIPARAGFTCAQESQGR